MIDYCMNLTYSELPDVTSSARFHGIYIMHKTLIQTFYWHMWNLLTASLDGYKSSRNWQLMTPLTLCCQLLLDTLLATASANCCTICA